MELAADLSRPFRPADARGFLEGRNHPTAGNWAGFDEDDVWNEDDINNFISGWWDRGRGDMGALRQQMAGEGFTNVPYINNVESPGSTSHVMLTDRPQGRDAVLRDREALKHPALRHLPNLTAGAGALSLGGLLAGDRDRQGY